MALNSSNLGGSSYINNLIGGALDIAAALFMSGLLKKLSRRRALTFLYLVFACFSIACPLISGGKIRE